MSQIKLTFLSHFNYSFISYIKKKKIFPYFHIPFEIFSFYNGEINPRYRGIQMYRGKEKYMFLWIFILFPLKYVICIWKNSNLHGHISHVSGDV